MVSGSVSLLCSRCFSPFPHGTCPLSRTHFPEGSATLMTRRGAGPTTPGAAAMHRPGLGSCAFARHYLRNHCYFLFLRVLRCFSSPGSPTASMRCDGIAPAGFPHSDIRGSRGICPSPRLFAACHVLLRLREPQASPMRPFSLSLVSSNGSLSARPPQGGRGAAAPSRPWSLSLDFSINSISRFDSRTRTAYTRTPGKRTARGRNEPL